MEWSEMTARQRDVWVAEWLGWTVDQQNDRTVYAGYAPDGRYSEVPRFTTDPALTQTVLAGVERRRWKGAFLGTLASLIGVAVVPLAGGWTASPGDILTLLSAPIGRICEAVWRCERDELARAEARYTYALASNEEKRAIVRPGWEQAEVGSPEWWALAAELKRLGDNPFTDTVIEELLRTVDPTSETYFRLLEVQRRMEEEQQGRVYDRLRNRSAPLRRRRPEGGETNRKP